MSRSSGPPVRRRRKNLHELKVHIFSTLIWWAGFSALFLIGGAVTGDLPSLELIVGILPFIALMEAFFFLGGALRR